MKDIIPTVTGDLQQQAQTVTAEQAAAAVANGLGGTEQIITPQQTTVVEDKYIVVGRRCLASATATKDALSGIKKAKREIFGKIAV